MNMKNLVLLPHTYKQIGWVLFVFGGTLGILLMMGKIEMNFLNMNVFAIINGELFQKLEFFTWIDVNMSITLTAMVFITGALVLAFSKEKEEDEFIQNLRLRSFQWSVIVNYSILLLAFVMVYGVAFFTLISIQIFLVIVLFIFRFHYLIYINKRSLKDEK
jgi:hypothetical protein